VKNTISTALLLHRGTKSEHDHPMSEGMGDAFVRRVMSQ